MTREEILDNCERLPNGCLIWKGPFNRTPITKSPYGKSVRQILSPHIGLYAHNTCGDGRCVSEEHTLFSKSRVLEGTRKRFCRRGHDLTSDNAKGPSRACLICWKQAKKEWDAANPDKVRAKRDRQNYKRKLLRRDAPNHPTITKQKERSRQIPLEKRREYRRRYQAKRLAKILTDYITANGLPS